MYTINIWGNCMTRDIVSPLTKTGKVKVLQYVGGGVAHPISAFSLKCDFEIESDRLKEYTGHSFDKRCLCQDINKTCLEYIEQKKADFLLIDMLAIRLNLLKKADSCMVCSYPYLLNKERLRKDYGLEAYEEVSPFEVDEKVWFQYIDKFCQFIARSYSPRQIIYHECFGTHKYIDSQLPHLKSFSKERDANVSKYNELMKKINAYFTSKMEGCHIIRFCDNVISDKAHFLGLHPLHYEKSYYEYGAKAIEVICRDLSDDEERSGLKELKQIYSDKFKLLNEKLELENRLFWINNALDFSKKMISDFFQEKKFLSWMENVKNRNLKVSVLTSKNIAGQELLNALEAYGIRPTLVSSKNNVAKLTKEELVLCRKSDIVINADVHNHVIYEKDDIKMICVLDLFD